MNMAAAKDAERVLHDMAGGQSEPAAGDVPDLQGGQNLVGRSTKTVLAKDENPGYNQKQTGLPVTDEAPTAERERIEALAQAGYDADEANAGGHGSEATDASDDQDDQPIIDMLRTKGIAHIRRINTNEHLVRLQKPKITGETVHARENRETRPDREGLDIEEGQSYVDNAKIAIYRQGNNTVKFLAPDGYVVLNHDHEMVTGVRQKWRKKYDQYLQEGQL